MRVGFATVFSTVIPAGAGVAGRRLAIKHAGKATSMGSRFRGNDDNGANA